MLVLGRKYDTYRTDCSAKFNLRPMIPLLELSEQAMLKKKTLINEALPGGGGGYLLPCSPEINWLVPLYPKNRKFVFLCPLFPNIVFVPLFPPKIWPLFPCSPEIYTPFPKKPWEGLIKMILSAHGSFSTVKHVKY